MRFIMMIAYAKASATDAGCYRILCSGKSTNIDFNFITTLLYEQSHSRFSCNDLQRGHSPAQKLPKKKKTLATIRLANKYFMEKWPDAGKPIFTNIERPSNIWTRAVYYEGLMALYAIDKKKTYYDYALQWGEKHKWGLRGGYSNT